MNLRLIVLLSALTVLAPAAALAQPAPEPQAVTINKRPLRDFAQTALGKIETREVDLVSPFRIEFEVVLGPDGKIDVSRSRVTKTDGDRNTTELVKNGIIAVGESGFFEYLRQRKVKPERLLVTVGLTKASFLAAVKVVTVSPNEAKSASSAISLLLAAGSQMQANPDDRLFLESTRVAPEGRSYSITMTLPAQVVRERILAEVKKKAKSE
jgi:hypothetical protein